jgi:hypothetical protein
VDAGMICIELSKNKKATKYTINLAERLLKKKKYREL